MTLTLTAAILSLHPAAQFGTDFIVAETLTEAGQIGPEEIALWNEETLGARDDAAIEKVRTAPLTAEQFAALKADLKAQADTAAEALRLTLITPGSGQAMEYQEAYAQAQAALNAAGAVTPADYPMLAVTIGVDIDPENGKPAADVLGVARSVKAAYEAYLQAGAAIRGARLLAKAEIDAAPDEDHARAVFAAIKWPTFG